MERLLVVGAETVVGANLALQLAETYHISTWSAVDRIDVPNCAALDPADAPHKALADARPDWLIYCGPAAGSAWDPRTLDKIDDEMVSDAEAWAAAAQRAGVRFVMISSDAVFTGPWMFHDEDCPGQCNSYQAHVIRATEQQVLECCPEALIVRTNAFGWSIDPEQGWLEQLLADVAAHRVVQQDHIRHASPILATDLALIIDRACQEKLTGVYHISGAERINPLTFTQRLSDLFNLPWLALRQDSVLIELPQGFGEGECSLQTKKVRKALCVPMPLLTEGLQRLVEQTQNGYRDQLQGSTAVTTQFARAA